MSENILIIWFGLMLGLALAFNIKQPITNIEYENYSIDINFSDTPVINVIDAKNNIYIWTYDKEEFNLSNGLLSPVNYSDNTEDAFIIYERVKS
jgi:hypothetical protein